MIFKKLIILELLYNLIANHVCIMSVCVCVCVCVWAFFSTHYNPHRTEKSNRCVKKGKIWIDIFVDSGGWGNFFRHYAQTSHRLSDIRHRHTHTHRQTDTHKQTDRYIVVHNIDWLTNASYTQTNLLKNIIYEKYFFLICQLTTESF